MTNDTLTETVLIEDVHPLRRAAQALRAPAFRWWFGSQLLSSSGSMTQAVAQSWLVLQLTGHAVDLGFLAAITWLPVLLGSAFAGGLVDRVDRRKLLVATQCAFLAISAFQAALVAAGEIQLWMIYVFAGATGVVTAVDSPARQVYVLEIVGRDRLASAIGLFEVMLNASRVIGPSLGGVLLATAGIAACFSVNAASFIPVLVALARYAPATGGPGAGSRAPAEVRDPADPPARARLAEGFAELRRDRVIGATVLVAAATGMMFNLGTTVPLLSSGVFHLGGGGFGAMMAAFGIGALPGAIAAAGSGTDPTGRRVRVLAAGTALAALLTASAPDAVAAFAGIAFLGFTSIWLIATGNTLVQLRARPEVRGRVMGIWTMAVTGLIPFTSLAITSIGQFIGGREGFGFPGAALTIATLVAWRALRR